MFAPASPDLLEAVQTRRQQFWLRLCIGVAICVALGPMLGWGLVGAWYALWASAQAVERHWAGGVASRVSAGLPVGPVPAVTFAFVTNFIFNGVAVAAILSESTWAIICGVWILSGGLLNAVGMSRNSTAMFLSGAAASFLPSLAVIVAAYRQGASIAEFTGLALGASLLFVAILVLRRLGLGALEEAKQASAAKSLFLATMSHEIRTPLNGVLGMVQAMAAGDLPGVQRERLEIIRGSGQALLALLNDILDLSKIEAGKLELELTIVDLEDIARELREVFEATCADKDIVLGLNVDPSVAGLWWGDPVRIRQVVSNLLSNAVKFTERGRVNLRLDCRDGQVEICIQDTGRGIAPDRLKAVFDKFVQADQSTTRDFGGTGLGLAICRDLTLLMGGDLTVTSTLGEGAEFTVRLPLERAKAGAAIPADAPISALPERPLRVLAAEDHKTNQAVLQVMLAQAGIEVHIVENGQEAVDAWARGPWDLILMDVQMPVMDGPTAVRLIRAQEAVLGRPRVPIIALTANAMKHHVEEYLACGMDAFVPKPFDFQTLLAVMGGLLDDAAATSADAGPQLVERPA